MWAESEVNISNCEFVDNSGGSTGEESVGAMSISNCDAMISNCIYDSNVADNPAAASLNHGTFVITGCSFSDNSGGAVLMGEGGLEVIDSTFTGNTGDHDGGAIRIRGHTNWVSQRSRSAAVSSRQRRPIRRRNLCVWHRRRLLYDQHRRLQLLEQHRRGQRWCDQVEGRRCDDYRRHLDWQQRSEWVWWRHLYLQRNVLVVIGLAERQ